MRGEDTAAKTYSPPTVRRSGARLNDPEKPVAILVSRGRALSGLGSTADIESHIKPAGIVRIPSQLTSS